MTEVKTLPRHSPLANVKGVANDARPKIVHEEVYQKLRRAIISGQLEPGRTLSVRGLAAEFGVSTMPAREAIRQLVALGALELTETRRVSVAQMNEDKLSEISEARLALEPELAARVLTQLKRQSAAREKLAIKLSKIDATLDRAIERGDSAAYARYNSEFHFKLYEAAKSPVYLGLVESLWLQIGPFMRVVIGRLGTSSLVDQHKEAVSALRADDVTKLTKAIRNDILEGMTNIARTDV
ncbi:GntR family transcriptional regulator [Hyphococcus lacteus]|uniref:GntR family transcriptional regulator n=1 Tax=Hyphococcus lacteus TaxID=3143536 RepID=A0ABV3Z8B2_9PROT